MKGSELGAILLKKHPTAEVVVRVGDDYVEIVGVGPTGVHRNAVTFVVCEPALGGGVIVVPPNEDPSTT